MNLSLHFTTSFCAAAVFGAAAATAFAQQTQEQNNQTRNQQNQAQPNQPRADQAGQRGAAGGQREQGSDQMLAGCVAIANQEEIAMAKMAEEKASSDEVKEFARMMLKDHQSYLQKLQKYSPEAASDGFLDGYSRTSSNQKQRDGQSRENQTSNNQVRKDSQVQPAKSTDRESSAETEQAGGNAQRSGQHINAIQLHKEIAQECLNSAKEKLGSKSGSEFDECYMHAQVAMHMGMKDKLTVFERHASGDLAQLFADGIKATEMHLKKAEQISKDLGKSSSNSKDDRKSDSKNKQ